MQAERLKILYELIEQEPNDPFNKYALGLELKNIDTSKAEEAFEKLVNSHPKYLPTYYQLGEVLVSQEKFEAAIPIYQTGIELAKEQGNSKTEKELIGVLQIVKDELEEW